MYICYIDESGDTGVSSQTIHSPTSWFVLNGFLIHESSWIAVLDALVNLRRNLRTTYGLPTRPELKGHDFRSGKGIFKNTGISLAQRMDIYRSIMNYQTGLQIRTFSVAIRKQQASVRGWDIRYCAWTFLLQRLDTFCRSKKSHCMIMPDEGHGFFIRQRVRSMKRFHHIPSHYGPGVLNLPVSRILEDPNNRRSQDSYFVQMADLNAYATLRSHHIDPDPTGKMDQTMWDNLSTVTGDVRLLVVNRLRGGPPGIVKYP